METDKQVCLVAQRNPQMIILDSEDLYAVGTLATILQMLKLPDGTLKVLVEGALGSLSKREEAKSLCRLRLKSSDGDLDEREAEVLTALGNVAV